MWLKVTLISALVLAYVFYSPTPDGLTMTRTHRYLIRPAMRVANLIPISLSQKLINPAIMPSRMNGISLEVLRPFPDIRESYLIQPEKATDNRPLVIYIHGGGFVFGNGMLELNQKLSKDTGMKVLSVGYGLAPDSLFPTAFLHCVEMTRWAFENADTLGIDVNRVYIMGDSAGGTLATGVVNYFSENAGRYSIRAQFLIYPSLQMASFNTSSYLQFSKDPSGVLDREQAMKFWLLYLFGNTDHLHRLDKESHVTENAKSLVASRLRKFNLKGKEINTEIEVSNSAFSEKFETFLADYRLNPLFAPDDILKKSPPTFIYTAFFDILRDEQIMYAERLRSLGVDVTHRMLDDLFHGAYVIDRSNPSAAEFVRTMTHDLVETDRSNRREHR